jgi:ribosomal protein L13E
MSSPDLAHIERKADNPRDIRASGDDKESFVYTNHRGITNKRRGRGFSQKEIVEAFTNIGLQNQNISKVRAFRIPIDNMRRSVHQENVTKLEEVLNGLLKQRTKNVAK